LFHEDDIHGHAWGSSNLRVADDDDVRFVAAATATATATPTAAPFLERNRNSRRSVRLSNRAPPRENSDPSVVTYLPARNVASGLGLDLNVAAVAVIVTVSMLPPWIEETTAFDPRHSSGG
jgi:hypothetical protein